MLGLALVSLTGVSWSAEVFSAKKQAEGFAKVVLGMRWNQITELMGAPQYVYQPGMTNTIAGY